MNHWTFIRRLVIAVTALGALSGPMQAAVAAASGYDQLVQLFNDWRAFERPPFVNGAPDYTAATLARRHQELAGFQKRLAAIDVTGWPVEQQVDHALVRAEMNGLDFYIRVLQPWVRDPAFYTTIWNDQSDTPAHEGSEHHGIVEVWMYQFPLSKEAEAKLAKELAIVPPLLAQAEGNLTGNARDLWITGAGSVEKQVASLDALAKKTESSGKALKKAIAAAREATAGPTSLSLVRFVCFGEDDLAIYRRLLAAES
jgi:hypothetical protein